MKRGQNSNKLSESQIEDLRLAASKMSGASRRAFQAEICLKYCDGNARKFRLGKINQPINQTIHHGRFSQIF